MDKSKINRTLSGCLLMLLAAFGCVLVLQLASLFSSPTTKTCSQKVCLKKFLEGPPAFNDDYMARYLQENFITPPSGGAMKLSGINEKFPEPFYNEILTFLDAYFAEKKNGRFVVLGAGDGEFKDYTINLEKKKGWTGLLVEPNPHLFKILKSKERNAELAATCVSPYSYPAKVTMRYPSFENTTTDTNEKILRYRESIMSGLFTGKFKYEDFSAQCIPLINLLYASKLIEDKIDLLVLDMTGSDMDMLMSTSLDDLPEFDMVLVNAHGGDIVNDLGGFFLERNMVVSRAFGIDDRDKRYIVTPFKSDIELA